MSFLYLDSVTIELNIYYHCVLSIALISVITLISIKLNVAQLFFVSDQSPTSFFLWCGKDSIKHWHGQPLLVFAAGVTGQRKQRESPSARQAAAFFGFLFMKGFSFLVSRSPRGNSSSKLVSGQSAISPPRVIVISYLGQVPKWDRDKTIFPGAVQGSSLSPLLLSPKASFETLPCTSSLFT